MASTGEEPPASPVAVADAPPLRSTEAKMIVATGRDDCQQLLKDMLTKEDHSTMVVVMASSHKASTPPKPPSKPMDPGLLAVASSGSWKKLQAFLKGDPLPTSRDERIKCFCCWWIKLPSKPRPTSSDGTVRCCCFLWRTRKSFTPAEPHPTSSDGATVSSAIQPPSGDIEAHLGETILEGVTLEGDTFLHVMAENSVDDDLIEDDQGLTRLKAADFLSRPNNNGDTPLHRAARADKSHMLSFLLDLARGNDTDKMKALLRTENSRGWTVLHEAVRVGNNDMVKSLMTEDSELATSLKDGPPKNATSPLYLAILLERKTIAETLYEKSGHVLSYSGPNGQNALHAAVLRGKDLTEMLLGWDKALTRQQDENGSTPLHLVASVLVPSMEREIRRELRTIYLLLLEANPDVLYQRDKEGLFPTHIAASIDATIAINDFLKKSPSCAGLRDARGRTFLHTAADNRKPRTVNSACRSQSLSWILNLQDNDGNSALHLAVQKGSLKVFCALLSNSKVQLNVTNEKGETPQDIAHCNTKKRGMQSAENSEATIHFALKQVGAKQGIRRQDNFEKNDTVQRKQVHDMGILTESTQNLCIGSVLIATVTFGATFAMPGGYRADDHTNGGTPTLGGRYAFDAFVVANTFAFAFSMMATFSLMSSGSPMYDLRVRVISIQMAIQFMFISITSLVAAFALGTYVMLAPVAHKVAITVCVMSCLVLLYTKMNVAIKKAMVFAAIGSRWLNSNNIIMMFPLWASTFMACIIVNIWPTILIFGLTALYHIGGKVEPAAQPPTPLP